MVVFGGHWNTFTDGSLTAGDAAPQHIFERKEISRPISIRGSLSVSQSQQISTDSILGYNLDSTTTTRVSMGLTDVDMRLSGATMALLQVCTSGFSSGSPAVVDGGAVRGSATARAQHRQKPHTESKQTVPSAESTPRSHGHQDKGTTTHTSCIHFEVRCCPHGSF